MTEDLLEVHKAEILQLKNSYEQYKDMYDKLARRQKLWNEYLDLEVVIHLLQLACQCFNHTGKFRTTTTATATTATTTITTTMTMTITSLS